MKCDGEGTRSAYLEYEGWGEKNKDFQGKRFRFDHEVDSNFKMAAINRPTTATTLAFHQTSSITTSDNEDHSFSGILFPIKCTTSLPLESLNITSFSVRGSLGPMTIWKTKHPLDSTSDLNANAEHWVKVRTERGAKRRWATMRERTYLYLRKDPPPSRITLQKLTLSTPITLKPNQIFGVYIHSSQPGDTALIYDNYCGRGPIYTDDYLTMSSGHAHVSNRPFGKTSMWGWGSPWRNGRCFVGSLDYGLFILQRRTCIWATLPDEVIMYILNMCTYDWFNDTVGEIEGERGRKREAVVQRNSSADMRMQAEYYGEESEEEVEEEDEEYVPSDEESGGGGGGGGPQQGQQGQQQGQQGTTITLEDLIAFLNNPAARGHPLYAALAAQFPQYVQDEDEDDSDDEFVEAETGMTQVMEDLLPTAYEEVASDDDDDDEGDEAMPPPPPPVPPSVQRQDSTLRIEEEQMAMMEGDAGGDDDDDDE
ncbi:hypothetical protein TL16_g01614 [Triparma laevis f. inornata]|uniref:Uncharacterized protein n=1 Tax=Triparma laevis f. inornata TaxID=1714386 RepID=A0A9W6ZGS5_9STRA|nr:hypothetical protein TL16_g01614 [Triparma laevis f. inornata]